MIYFTADQHFGHFQICNYCNRPFKTIEEMNETLIKNHNRYVQPNDVVYHLGDFGYGGYDSIKEILNKLNGKHTLILGNHDRWGMETYLKLGFSAVLYSADIKIGKRIIHLNHIPYRTFTEFLRICWVYMTDMRDRKKTIKHIYYRIRKEWKRYKKADKNWAFVGHIHTAWLVKGKNINVGVDQWNYKPVPLKDLISLMDKLEAKQQFNWKKITSNIKNKMKRIIKCKD